MGIYLDDYGCVEVFWWLGSKDLGYPLVAVRVCCHFYSMDRELMMPCSLRVVAAMDIP